MFITSVCTWNSSDTSELGWSWSTHEHLLWGAGENFFPRCYKGFFWGGGEEDMLLYVMLSKCYLSLANTILFLQKYPDLAQADVNFVILVIPVSINLLKNPLWGRHFRELFHVFVEMSLQGCPKSGRLWTENIRSGLEYNRVNFLWTKRQQS